MIFETGDPRSRRRVARIAGGAYLAFILTSVLADVVAHIGLGGTEQILGAIGAGGVAFRLGLTIAYVSALLFLFAAWCLYVVLRGVNRDLALLFLLLNAVGVAVQCAAMLQLVSALGVLEASGTAPGLGAAEAETMARLSIEVYRSGFVLAQLFYGTWLFPLGYLVFTSGFIPRTLGVLLLLDGVAEMVWFLQALLLPDYPAIKIPGTLVSLAAEVGLAGWLLIVGVKTVAPGKQGQGRGLRVRPGEPR